MAIYEFKDFLNIDDVAKYLTDKDVSDFYPLTPHTKKRFDGLLSEWIKLGKLRPLYPFDEFVMQYKMDYGFEIHENNVMEFAENILDDFERMQNGEPKKYNHKGKRIDIGKKFINDYLIFGNSIWEDLCKFEKSELGILDWNKFYNDENNKYQFDIIYCDDIPQEYRKFTILRNKVLFLKSELDTIFNPNQTTDTATLQTQLEQAHARMAELEQQLAMQNTTPTDVEKAIYTNTALTALFDVMNTYWQNPEQPPKQEFIKKWIVEKYPSIDPSKALWIDKIIRHQDRK